MTSDPSVLTPAQAARDDELRPRANAVLAAFANDGAYVTRSGAIVFGSNRDGVRQLYVGDVKHPKDAPRRLVTGSERIGAMAITPDEKTILFSSDTNADGNFHIFRIGVDGSGLADLTPVETLHRDGPRVARGGAGLFAYSAHAPASEKTRVFVQGLDGKPPRAIYSDDRGGNVVDMAADGKHALFERLNSDEDTVVFDIDVESGKATRIFPPEGQAANALAAYSAEGERVFVATEHEGKHAEVLAIDRTSGKTLASYEETTLPNGTIAAIVASPAGDWVAIDVDGGNHDEVRVLEARTLKLRKTLTLPLGVAEVGKATKDGKRFTLVESRPDAPTDVFEVDARTGAVSPLRDDDRPGMSAMAPLAASIQTLSSFDGTPVPVNLYLPVATESATRKLPVIVLIHGGPTSSAPLRWSASVRFYTSLGYAVVEPNIRGSTGFGVAYERADNKEKRADALKDVEAVNAWTRAQPWCDPDRITIAGGSYGGYMTLLAAARQPTLWRAGLDASGMSDLRTMEKLEDQSIRVFDETEFGALGKEDDLLYEWSPLKHVSDIVAPVFVYQGVHDPITPQNEADQIVKALRQRKVPVEYMLVANEGHGLSRRENTAEYLVRTARFLEEHAGAR